MLYSIDSVSSKNPYLYKMSSFIPPEKMNNVQKMRYLSAVSKVSTEMETHLGFSEKTVAEVCNLSL